MRPIREPGNARNLGGLKVFVPFILRYRFWVLMTLISLAGVAASNLVIPLFAGRIFDFISVENSQLDLQRYIGLAFLTVSFMALSGFGRIYFSQRLAFRVITDLRSHIFGHLIGLSRFFYDQNRSGEILSRLSADVRETGFILSSTVAMAARQILVFIGALLLMFYTSTTLAWMVMLVVPLVVLPMIFISRRLQKYARAATDSYAEATNVASEAIQNIAAVQSYNQIGYMFNAYEKENEKHYASHFNRILTYASLVAYFIFCVFGAIIFVFWQGAQMVANGEMTQGDLIQFSFYALMVGGAAQSFSDIWGDLLRAAGAGERLSELMRTKENLEIQDNPITPNSSAPMLQFKNVEFAYPSKPEQMVLADLNFELREGEQVAIVGPSGAGKSTIFQLLLRHYDAKGDIFLRGQKIREVSLENLRSNFAYVSQEPAIFATTIAENIAFARPDASIEDIKTAAKSAFADEFIDNLPDGYQSLVGERGVLLSGGQKARLALARAFLSEAPILILDEATAALDAQSESYVQRAVANLSSRKTVIAIAHRFSTVKSSDRILVLDQGRLKAEGTHDELIKSSELYARLSKLQFINAD